VSRGQAEVRQTLLAAFQHAVESGQVLAVLDGVFGALQDLFHRVIRQGVQPQFLDLLELLRIRESRIVLVVVVQAEQREDLVDGLDVGLGGGPAGGLSLPRRYR